MMEGPKAPRLNTVVGSVVVNKLCVFDHCAKCGCSEIDPCVNPPCRPVTPELCSNCFYTHGLHLEKELKEQRARYPYQLSQTDIQHPAEEEDDVPHGGVAIVPLHENHAYIEQITFQQVKWGCAA